MWFRQAKTRLTSLRRSTSSARSTNSIAPFEEHSHCHDPFAVNSCAASQCVWAAIARLRFSLRQLFLVMIVCAALAAWLHEVRDKQRPLQQSHIADYFTTELQKDVAAARIQTGETAEAWRSRSTRRWT